VAPIGKQYWVIYLFNNCVTLGVWRHNIGLDDIRIGTKSSDFCRLLTRISLQVPTTRVAWNVAFFFKWPAKEKNRSAFGTRFRNKSLCRPRVTTTRCGVFIHDRTIIINYNNIITLYRIANKRVRVNRVSVAGQAKCASQFVGGRISVHSRPSCSLHSCTHT